MSVTKSGLPDELILTNYFTVQDARIVTLFVIRNMASEYAAVPSY
jgi:hypothetical protein